MQICSFLNFLCISVHTSNEHILQIHVTYAIYFDHDLCRIKNKTNTTTFYKLGISLWYLFYHVFIHNIFGNILNVSLVNTPEVFSIKVSGIYVF